MTFLSLTSHFLPSTSLSAWLSSLSPFLSVEFPSLAIVILVLHEVPLNLFLWHGSPRLIHEFHSFTHSLPAETDTVWNPWTHQWTEQTKTLDSLEFRFVSELTRNHILWHFCLFAFFIEPLYYPVWIVNFLIFGYDFKAFNIFFNVSSDVLHRGGNQRLVNFGRSHSWLDF